MMMAMLIRRSHDTVNGVPWNYFQAVLKTTLAGVGGRMGSGGTGSAPREYKLKRLVSLW